MSEMTIPQALQLGIEHHTAGRLVEAEAIYRQILAAQPQHADALHLLGALACAKGNYPVAIELIGRAIRLMPNHPNFHANLGETYRRAGQHEQAIAACRTSIALDSRSAGAFNNLGLALAQKGERTEAITMYRKALELQPAFPEVWLNLGEVYSDQGDLETAVACYQTAIRQNPASSTGHNNLGAVYLKQHRYDDAMRAFQTACKINPNDAEAMVNLGNSYVEQKRYPDAKGLFERTIRLDPKRAEAYSGLGCVLKTIERPDEAIAAYRKALALHPTALDLANLGLCLRDRGQPEEAVVELRKALELDPKLSAVHSAIIVTMLLTPGVTPELIEAEQRSWNQRYARPEAANSRPFEHDPTPGRRLRVGYVSPDFRDHPVGRFMLPLLAAHDAAATEIYAYSGVVVKDWISHGIEEHSDHWRPIVESEDLIRQVREDKIDILVDLAMHTRNNHLLAFAQKLAPIQVSYLAYAGGTGMEAMDFRLTDRFIDPPGQGDAAAFEKPWRLPDSFWCYAPGVATPAPNALPAKGGGGVTFASLSHIAKVTPPTMACWAEILKRVPGSKLRLHIPPGWAQDRARAVLGGAGVDLGRVSFAAHLPIADYFASYHGVDIALDPFPYAGGTTTCDALWMGVPVVTLTGAMPTSRSGVSLLSTLGLPELIARSREEYMGIAVGLAGDLRRLARLRGELRGRMLASPLTDAKRFVGNLEGAYRAMWKEWCGRGG